MPRKKVKLAWIPNDTARRSTFYRRKKGVMKKLSELSTLCDITSCAVIYSPYKQQPDAWPSPEDAERLLNMFKSMPEIEQCKKILNHEEYLRQRITKVEDQRRKICMENRRKEMMMMLISECFQGKDLYDLTMLDLTDLTAVLDGKMKAIEKRIEELKQNQPEIGTSKTMAGASSSEEDSSAMQVDVNAIQGQPWFVPGMNLNEPSPCFGDEVVQPYVDNPAWTAAPFFP